MVHNEKEKKKRGGGEKRERKHSRTVNKAETIIFW